MNYIRDFYKQSGGFKVDLGFTDSGSNSPAIFGLSGGNTLTFEVENGLVSCEGYRVSSLDESQSVFVTVAGNGSNTTAWIDNQPVYTRTGAFSFEKIYCNSPADFLFNNTLLGEQPDLSVDFSGWVNQTGYMYLVNNGSDTLEINSALLENSYVYVNSYASSIAPGGTGIIELIYQSNSTTSGTGQLNLETNAGAYNLGQFLEYEWVNNFGDIDIYFESGFYNPSGSSKFFIQNRYQRDVDVHIFLDDQNFFSIADNSGNPLVSNTGEEFYLTIPRYATVRATGHFSSFIGASVTGPQTFPVNYSGTVTGIGGRLGLTGIEFVKGKANLVVYPTGQLVYEYAVLAPSLISGSLFYGTITGSLTGIVGPGSGAFHFSQTVTGNALSAVNPLNEQVITPTVFDVFTGTINTTKDLSSSVIGTYDYYIFEDIQIYEGNGEYIDLWQIDVNDIDRGVTDNFYESGWWTPSGYGEVTGISYRIPQDGRITGEVRYNNSYQSPIIYKMSLRVTDFNSINQQISIESR